MKPSGWVALALLALSPAPAHGSFVIGFGPAFGGLPGSHVSVRFRSPHLSFYASRFTVFPQFGGGYLGPYPFVPFYSGFVPWSAYPLPAWGYPYAGAYNPYAIYGQPPFVMPPIIAPAPPGDPGDALPPQAPAAAGPRGRGAPLRGEPAGRFRPVGPQDRERARQPLLPELAPIAPRPAPPRVPNPLAEQAALVQAGRKAFTSGLYGRAAELFQQATAAAPALADAFFLLAQTQLALGKYQEAVATIHQGLAKQPDWPTDGPSLRELYAADPGAWAEHRRQLDEAATAWPGDPALDFLRAYVYWFDGRRDEARALFRQVRERVAKPEVIDRFLAAPSA
jgi:hypothetical protein